MIRQPCSAGAKHLLSSMYRTATPASPWSPPLSIAQFSACIYLLSLICNCAFSCCLIYSSELGKIFYFYFYSFKNILILFSILLILEYDEETHLNVFISIINKKISNTKQTSYIVQNVWNLTSLDLFILRPYNVLWEHHMG